MNRSWDENLEKKAKDMRGDGLTYRSISDALGFSVSAVKHKIRRLQQCDNLDKYKHTKEKADQASKFIERGRNHFILETHSGFGGMTKYYAELGEVESYDIKSDRVEAVNLLGFESVQAIKGDSEREIYRLIVNKCKYTVIDIDPYGMPSRYFPHIFDLIDDGLLFITLPMIGVAQINKITIRHLEAFWGVKLKDKDVYIEKVIGRLSDYAFMHKRDVEILDVLKIDRIYRICIKVTKRSCCEIVGLTVNR